MEAEDLALDPAWWLKRLYVRLVKRRPDIAQAARYYDGEHNLAFASEKFLDAFGGLFRAFADNWCALVVDAVEERLNVTGFRVPAGDDGDTDKEAEKAAWRIWQANNLDTQAQIGHLEALIHGTAAATVWVKDDSGKSAEITVEHPESAIVETHPKRPLERRAGLRCYMDDAGYEHAELFLPDKVYLFRSKAKRDHDIVDPARLQWIPDVGAPGSEESGGYVYMNNPFGVVPMVELPNRPRIARKRTIDRPALRSEIAGVIPLQDAVNKLIADMLVASETAADPQRILTGYELEIDEQTQQPKPLPFKRGDGIWVIEDPDGKFGTLQATDISNYVTVIETIVQHIASITRTPPHYLNASADRLSGESIKAAETGLVAKVSRRQQHFGEAWEEVIRLAGKIEGVDALEQASAAEVIWRDPESRTESEHVDAVVKKKALGLPNELLWEELDMTPTTINRAKAMLVEEDLFGPAEPAAPPAVPAVPEPTPVV